MVKTRYIIVFVTVPDKKTANKIKNAVLGTNLCACVNMVSGISSFYWWKEKIEYSSEILLILKTVKKNYKKLENAVKKNHPYDVPEIVSIDISGGSKDYLNWIKEYAK